MEKIKKFLFLSLMSFLLESAPSTKSSLKRSIRGPLTEYPTYI
ncbi:MAG: hypothetical protein SO435_00345 [Peptostreptococcus porci]|nr:hypothetical protein [Peptostreptococcus porci]